VNYKRLQGFTSLENLSLFEVDLGSPFNARHYSLHEFIEQRYGEGRISVAWAPNHSLSRLGYFEPGRAKIPVFSAFLRYLLTCVGQGQDQTWLASRYAQSVISD